MSREIDRRCFFFDCEHRQLTMSLVSTPPNTPPDTYAQTSPGPLPESSKKEIEIEIEIERERERERDGERDEKRGTWYYLLTQMANVKKKQGTLMH